MLADPRIYEDVMRKIGKPVAVMQKEPTPEILEAMRQAYRDGVGGIIATMRAGYHALYAHQSKPSTHTEWEVRGFTGRVEKTYTIVVTENERDRAVRLAEKLGCDIVTTTKREVAA